MKKQSFLKHFMIIGSGAVINMLIGLLTTPLITRIVEPVDYGHFAIFNTYANIVMMIACLGLDQTLVRYYYNKDDVGYKRKLLFMCLGLPLIVLLLMAILATTVLERTEYFKNFSSIYLSATFVTKVLFLILHRFSLLTLRLEKKSSHYSICEILHKIIYVGVAVFMIRLFDFNNFYLLIIAAILSYAVPAIIGIISERRVWNPFGPKCDESIEYKKLIQYGAPLLLANGVYMLFQAIDKISLTYFCDYEVVGVYASAMSLMSIIAIIRTTFNTIWSPASIEHYEKNPDDKTFYQKGNRYITFIMFAFGISLMLGKDLIAFLLGPKYRDAAMIMPFLLFQPIMYTVSETTVVGIYFKKKSYVQLIISATACIFNIVGNFILIPLVGAKGAAISTGLSYILFFTLRTIFSQKYYYVDYGLAKFYFATLIAILYALYNTFVEFNIWTVILYIVTVIIGCWLYKDTVRELVDITMEKLLKKRGKSNV